MNLDIDDLPLPPIIPANLTEYDAAVCLLGHYIQTGTGLTDQSKYKLVRYFGIMPSYEQAIAWKANLKKRRRKFSKMQQT